MNTLPFDYQIIRSRRRTLGITVANAEVQVRAPLRAPKAWINEFIVEKSDWIARKLEEQKIQLAEVYQLKDRTNLPLLDEVLTLHISPGTTARASRRDNYLRISAPVDASGTVNSQKVHQAFNRWIKREANGIMTPRCRQLAEDIGLADKLSDIRYRRTSSKWGHCTSQGVIQFNPFILMAPEFVVDYIIAHEVCHLKHTNHSKTYWRFVDRIFPRRVEAEYWLKTQGHRLAIN